MIVFKIIHALIVLFVVTAPFFEYPPLTVVHILFCILLMIHWATNQNVCFLTVLESQVSGKPMSQTFIHSLLEPVYKIQENSLNIFIWTFTISITIYSMYSLYKNPKVRRAFESPNFKEALVILFS